MSFVWTTSTGEKLTPKEMDTAHIQNILNHLCKRNLGMEKYEKGCEKGLSGEFGNNLRTLVNELKSRENKLSETFRKCVSFVLDVLRDRDLKLEKMETESLVECKYRFTNINSTSIVFHFGIRTHRHFNELVLTFSYENLEYSSYPSSSIPIYDFEDDDYKGLNHFVGLALIKLDAMSLNDPNKGEDNE